MLIFEFNVFICMFKLLYQIGTIGHSVQPSIHNALQKWSKQRMRTVEYVRKGMNCLTEMYSVIEAEVPVVTDPGTTKNKKLLAELTQVKRLIVCGQVSKVIYINVYIYTIMNA